MEVELPCMTQKQKFLAKWPKFQQLGRVLVKTYKKKMGAK